MAWTIHRWSPDNGRGEIRSPHFDPIPFGPVENTTGTSDYEVGEAVFVELDEGPAGYVVRKLWPARQRQPAGTRYPAFDAVNGRYGDLRVDELTPSSVRLWLGDCCESCCPNASRVTFDGLAGAHGLDEDLEEYGASNPLLRLASEAEVAELGIEAPTDGHVFCVVEDHGNGFDGRRVYLVARQVVVETGRDASTVQPQGRRP